MADSKVEGQSTRGQALLESLLGMMLVLAIAGAILTSIALTNTAARSISKITRLSNLASVEARLRRESRSAMSIYVPALDARGVSNADGHEVRFLSRNSSGNDLNWAYNWDSFTHNLLRINLQADTSDIIGSFHSFSARTLSVSQLSNSSITPYVPRDVKVTTTKNEAYGGNAITEIKASDETFSRTVRLTAGTALSGFLVIQQLPVSPRNPLVPAPSPVPSSGIGGGCSADQVELSISPDLPPPGSESDPSQSSNFRVVCRKSSGQIITQETAATPCVVDGVNHQGIQPKTLTLPQQITYLRQWTPDGGTTWENFANVEIEFSDSTPPTVACDGYGPGVLTTTTYWDGSQTQLDGSYNQ